MIVTEAALREQLRQPRIGARVAIPAGASLSPSAADFVAQWKLEVVRGAAPEAGVRRRPAAPWDTPSVFPVVLEGDIPVCTTCGSPVRSKPDSMTQLNASHFAPKTHRRIRLRGRLDSLQALALLVASRAGATGDEELRRHLGVVAAYCRELMSAEYNERVAAPLALADVDEVTIHAATHDPATHLGIDHLTPGEQDPELLHWLNLLRCNVREAEITALEAFSSCHDESGGSVVHGLNRLSSLVYYLELRLMARPA